MAKGSSFSLRRARYRAMTARRDISAMACLGSDCGSTIERSIAFAQVFSNASGGERLRQLRGADGSRRAAVLQKSQKSAARRLHAGQGVELEEPFQRYRFDEDQILQFVERISDLRLRVLVQSLSQFCEIRGVRGQAQKLPIKLGQATLRILTSSAPVLRTLVHPIGVRHMCALLLIPRP